MTDFKAKMHQIRFRLGLRPRPRWGSLQRSPRPPCWIWGPTSKEREREGGEGRTGEGRRGKGRGREEREGGKERAMSPPLFGGSLRLWCPPTSKSWLRHCTSVSSTTFLNNSVSGWTILSLIPFKNLGPDALSSLNLLSCFYYVLRYINFTQKILFPAIKHGFSIRDVLRPFVWKHRNKKIIELFTYLLYWIYWSTIFILYRTYRSLSFSFTPQVA